MPSAHPVNTVNTAMPVSFGIVFVLENEQIENYVSTINKGLP